MDDDGFWDVIVLQWCLSIYGERVSIATVQMLIFKRVMLCIELDIHLYVWGRMEEKIQEIQ